MEGNAAHIIRKFTAIPSSLYYSAGLEAKAGLRRSQEVRVADLIKAEPRGDLRSPPAERRPTVTGTLEGVAD